MAALRAPGAALAAGVRIEARGLTRHIGAARVLSDVSLSVAPGEVVAIAGGSGAGKTTLLEALAGVRPADSGSLRFDGVDVYSHLDAFRTALGYVPQDDIIHTELPLRMTLRYAARLRLASSTTAAAIDDAVTEALRGLDLTSRADVHVRALSGGQRKRASVAVELLTRPRVFFLDEPTSGLDPATGAELMRVLRHLAAMEGATVVLTTHSPFDLESCDRVVFLTTGGTLAFAGTLDEALRHFDVNSPEKIYLRLASEATPEEWARRFSQNGVTQIETSLTPDAETPPDARPGAGWMRQWLVSSQRTLETLVRNPLTLVIMVGSPIAVVAMFALLFEPGAFDFAHPSPTTIVMIVFWITFAAFFFGLTYGLLQVCTERAMVSREFMVGLRLSAYLMSKVVVLVPFLIIVNVLMLGALRLFDRLPVESLGTYTTVAVTLSLCGTAALSLGLLTSVAVSNPAQATLALPMLCFPAVLFSGAILPVHLMAPVGVVFSVITPVRWAFEAMGHDMGLRDLFAHGGSPLGPPLLASYADAGQLPTLGYWAWLLGFIIVFFVGAFAMLRWRCSALRVRPK